MRTITSTTFKTIVGAVLLALGGSAGAASPLYFTYLDASYLDGEAGSSERESEGFRAAFSAETGRRSFFIVEHDLRDIADPVTGDEELRFTSAGFGFKTNTRLVPRFAMLAAVTYERLKLEGVVRDSDEGYGLQFGMRGWIADMFEANASYKRLDFGDDSGAEREIDLVRGGLVVPLSRAVSLTATYQHYDRPGPALDLEEFLVGFRIR